MGNILPSTFAIPEDMIIEDITITALWKDKPVVYTITYKGI